MNTLRELHNILDKRIMILDGAMGTMLAGKPHEGIVSGSVLKDTGSRKQVAKPEWLSLTHPDAVFKVHLSYLEAGADIISTNTFNANSVMQEDYDDGKGMFELNQISAGIARAAIRENYKTTPTRPRFVAGVIGPTDKVAYMAENTNLNGLNGIRFNELYEAYIEQIRGLTAGGADILLIETITDLLNAKAAVQAARDAGGNIPLVLSFAILDDPNNTGTNELIQGIISLVKYSSPLATGFNCFPDMEMMLPVLEELSSRCPCYTIVYPNAGFPDQSGNHPVTAEKFEENFRGILAQGLVNIAGGCCGTAPGHIRWLAGSSEKYVPRKVF